MIQAVIFDMDGLLIDSEPFWQQAKIEVFQTVGIQLTPEFLDQTTGLRTDVVVAHLYDRCPWNQKTKKQVETEIRQHVMEQVRFHGQPQEGIKEIISFFEIKKLPLALASSSSYELIHLVLNKLGVLHRFQVIYSGDEEPLPKPHPGIYLNTATKLGIVPECCLAFEDSLNGMLSAKSARMKVVAIPEVSQFTQTRYDFCDLKLRSLREFDETRFAALNA